MKINENEREFKMRFLNYLVYFGIKLAFITFFHPLPKFLRFKGSLRVLY